MAGSHSLFATDKPLQNTTTPQFAADPNQAFNMEAFVRDFAAQYNQRCAAVGLTVKGDISCKLIAPNNKFPYTHYTISYGVVEDEDFTARSMASFFFRELENFFKKNKISVKSANHHGIAISKEQLDASTKLNAKVVGTFFFELNQKAKVEQDNITQRAEQYRVLCGKLKP